ncbi:MAG: VWA domain-containing protein [Bacteroidales bacterium]|nr:VWA domain-containing protein [Bacteroidales bacterium]
MEPDQLIFKKFVDLFKRFKKTDPELLERTAKLEVLSGRLTLIATALCGRKIEVLSAEMEGGRKDHLFYLPANFSLLPGLEKNIRFYFFRVVYLSIQLEHELTLSQENTSVSDSRLLAKADSGRLIEIMEKDFPSVAKYYHSIKDLFGAESKNGGKIPDYWLYGKYMNHGRGNTKLTSNPDLDNTGRQNLNPKTEMKSKPVEEAEVINVDKKTQEDYVLMHNFEKVDTAEEFKGVWRNFDGDDSLEKDAEALNELNLKHLVRTDDEAHSVYQADFRDLQGIAESIDKADDGRHVCYDEWNYQNKQYKTDYCRVYLKSIRGDNLNYASAALSGNTATLNGLRRQFAQIHQKRQIARRRDDGEEIDMDAVVEMLTDIKSGHTPSENIYISKRKKEPDISILFLMDLSLSTDSYAAGNRILDVEKQAVILFGQVLHEYGVDFAIGGFYSKTRNNCAYIPVKGFDDDWTKAKRNIGAVEPRGYTRIGPALRHSNALISERQMQNKWVILLSDGKPNDYDKYEGRYGIADVKQALREMNEYHINTYAIAIESTAKYYLPQMFGQNHYTILSHPDMLLHSLTTLYQRIQNH